MNHVILFILLFLLPTTSVFSQIKPLNEFTARSNMLTTQPAPQNFNLPIFNSTLPQVLDQVFDSMTTRTDLKGINAAILLPDGQSNGYLLKKNQFSVGIGVGYFKMVDFQFSPNLYQSVRKNLQLGYSNRWKKGIFSTKLNVFFGGLTLNSGSELNFYLQETDIYGVEIINQEEIKLSQLGLNVELGYLHKLSKLASSNTMLYLGGSLEECLIYTPGFLSMGTINYGSLNAKARFDYFLGNGKPIILGLSFPIVSMVTRLPYHNAPNYPGKSGIQGFFTDNNQIETLGHFQNFRFSAKYNWLVRKRVALDITYEASWMHYNRPEHLTQMGNQLTLGFNF